MQEVETQQFVLEPLPKSNRRWTFIFLLALFVFSLPFLYLYATGYRFELSDVNIVSTGGIYVAVERTGAEIYIDDELVRETRAFRRAFYAQSLDPGTHKVHVQKDGHHTWVKELPVSAHLVTEAQAFNLPLVPNVRVISQWQSATGSAVIRGLGVIASTTNEYVATTTTSTRDFTENSEYEPLLELFSTTSATSSATLARQLIDQIDTFLATSTATGTAEAATTTLEIGGVRLFESGDDVYARWVGPQESMPYYYCAEEFPRYSTTTLSQISQVVSKEQGASVVEGDELIHPVQTLPEDLVCDPTIRIDRMSQAVRSFDFYPGTTDLVILGLEDGMYVVEIDDRAWQNVQPLLLGEDLEVRTQNGQIYAYDGELIYQIITGS